MAPSHTIFHALLRPSVLQILRATGYHSCKPAVLEALTDLAANYLALLSAETARHAADNNPYTTGPTLLDVRLALEEVGALNPHRVLEEEEFWGEEDTRGVDEFVRWFAGPQNKQIVELARVDGEVDAGDYLNALKKKHSKTGEDSKYHGTILGKSNEHGEIEVEGGDVTSVEAWNRKIRGPSPPPMVDDRPGSSGSGSRPPSSGLSSVGDRLGDDIDMD